MSVVKEEHILYGPEPLEPILDVSLGRIFYDVLSKMDNERVAMVDVHTGQSLTYRTFFEDTCILADYLRKSRYNPSYVMGVSSPNNLQFFVPIISCLYIGATVVPINHSYTIQELKHVLNISKPRVIFCSASVANKYLEMKKYLPGLDKIIVIDSEERIPGTFSMLQLLRNRRIKINSWKTFIPLDGKPENLRSYILCSSGTTGLPKGVLLSHLNILIRLMHTRDPRYSIWLPNDSVLGLLPFFHGFGLITTLGAIFNGIRIIVVNRFEEKLFLESIQNYRITILWLAPPLAVFLAKSPLVQQYDMSSVREVTIGAAPLGKNIQEELKRRFHINHICQGYGLSEATMAVILLQYTDTIKYGSSGKVVSYMKGIVRDPETGKSVGPNVVGELCFKGPFVMVGYYGDEKSTKESFTSDGWLLSGDLGYYDEDGFIFIVDRLKELIKYKAFQVAPAELEAILLKHPKIRDAGVVGLPDEVAGELPMAFVVKHGGVNLTEKEVQEFVAATVSPQKRLRGGVVFVDEIPKNASGKILRRKLKELLNKHKSKL